MAGGTWGGAPTHDSEEALSPPRHAVLTDQELLDAYNSRFNADTPEGEHFRKLLGTTAIKAIPFATGLETDPDGTIAETQNKFLGPNYWTTDDSVVGSIVTHLMEHVLENDTALLIIGGGFHAPEYAAIDMDFRDTGKLINFGIKQKREVSPEDGLRLFNAVSASTNKRLKLLGSPLRLDKLTD